MSRLEQLLDRYEKEKNNLLKEKINLNSELTQLRDNKIHYKQKADILAFNRAVNEEQKINNKLQLVESNLVTLEKNYNKQITEEKQKQDKIERKRREKEKEKQTKMQMDDVLRYMKQGTTRREAAESVGIKESKILHWYKEGELGTSKNTIYFYKELTEIEKDQKKQKKIIDKIKQDTINGIMDDVLFEMKNGNNRQQAAQNVGVKVSQVNEWYDNGLNQVNNTFHRFYKKVNEIESSQKYSSNCSESEANAEIKDNKLYSLNDNYSGNSSQKSTSIVRVNYCQNCGKKLSNDESKYCSNCGSSLIIVKKTDSGRSNSGSKSGLAVSMNNSGKCCSGLMVMFIVIAILIVIF